MSEPTSMIDYWQRKGHMLHLRTQDGQPYGSVRRKCDQCGVMIWPERTGAETPEWTDDRAEYAESPYRCNAFKENAMTEPADSGMCPNCVTPWKCNGPHELTPTAEVSRLPG